MKSIALFLTCLSSLFLSVQSTRTNEPIHTEHVDAVDGTVTQNWQPVYYRIYTPEDGQHHDRAEDYSSDHCVLINPEAYLPGRLQARLEEMHQRWQNRGYASQAEYHTDVHNDRILGQAAKIISLPNDRCGALLINGANHVYYNQALAKEEVERRAQDEMLPELYLEDGKYWLNYPWQTNPS